MDPEREDKLDSDDPSEAERQVADGTRTTSRRLVEEARDLLARAERLVH